MERWFARVSVYSRKIVTIAIEIGLEEVEGHDGGGGREHDREGCLRLSPHRFTHKQAPCFDQIVNPFSALQTSERENKYTVLAIQSSA